MATATVREGKTQTEDHPTQVQKKARTIEIGLRGPTGPRTRRGKQKSRYNALKHGIFAALVLKGESSVEYRRLLEGLRESCQPEGQLEEALVEKLAMTLWRHRRLIKAEAAEIQQSAEFVEWDKKIRQRREAEEIDPFFIKEKGLMRKTENPVVLQRCLELLAEMGTGIGERGFDFEQDHEVLTKLYGDFDEERVIKTLFDEYVIWVSTSAGPDEEREQEGYATPAQCKENVLREIDKEVRRLKAYQKQRTSIELARTKLEVLRRQVPDTPGWERLLRYEASLERSFERTLSQIERLQRMRLGHAVPPPVKVELSP